VSDDLIGCVLDNVGRALRLPEAPLRPAIRSFS
jgi:hypothetical protein